MIVHNSRVTVQAYPAALQQILSIAAAQESRRWLASWHRISPQPTPLYELPGLAQQLGVITSAGYVGLEKDVLVTADGVVFLSKEQTEIRLV